MSKQPRRVEHTPDQQQTVDWMEEHGFWQCLPFIHATYTNSKTGQRYKAKNGDCVYCRNEEADVNKGGELPEERHEETGADYEFVALVATASTEEMMELCPELTEQDARILAALSSGLGPTEISEYEGIARQTVYNRISRIRRLVLGKEVLSESTS